MEGQKLTKSQIASSLFAFIMYTLLLIAVVFLTMIYDAGGDIFNYVRQEYRHMILIVATIVILIGITYCYFYFESPKILRNQPKILEIFTLMYLTIVAYFVVGRFVHINARPVAIFALMTIALIGRKEAIFLNIIVALVTFIIDFIPDILSVGFTDSMLYMITCFLSTFTSGMVAIFLSQRVKTRLGSVMMAFAVLFPNELLIAILESVLSMEMKEYGMLLVWGAVGALLSAILYLIFLPIFEVIFAELTTFRLRELTSDDAKLIKKLKNEAPGTYHHSVMVAQLVEACAKEIGEDSELARAAAYYHDIGKLKNPEMFTENQMGEKNVHDELTPELSVDIIRSHARDGAMLIKKAHLPEFFADIAVQHHGTLPIKYFYYKALRMTDGELNIENYSYLGPKPHTKIAAIIMIADAAEAATRSLSDRSASSVEELVRKTIEERMDLGQFDYCHITLAELTIIKQAIVAQLTGIYHSRIAYPKLKVSKKG